MYNRYTRDTLLENSILEIKINTKISIGVYL